MAFMEFWGAEVKPGQSIKCGPEENKFYHLSQVSLGESKGNENVPVFVKFNDQKLIVGTLSMEKCAQISLDLIFEKEFELSHTSKRTSVYFCGYKSIIPEDHSDTDDYPESESTPEGVSAVQNANGKPEDKQDQAKSGAGQANNTVKEDTSTAKKATKTATATKEALKGVEEDDEDTDDEEDDEEDSAEESDSDEMAEAMSDSDGEDEDESSEEEEKVTPRKVAPNKRLAESAPKSPAPEKKAKVITPIAVQKQGAEGKKHVHVATPHPAKKPGKMPGNSEKPKQSPKSAGSMTCKSCNRTFNSERGLQDHTKAKHS